MKKTIIEQKENSVLTAGAQCAPVIGICKKTDLLFYCTNQMPLGAEPGGIFGRLKKRKIEGLWNEVLPSDMHDQHAVDHLDAPIRREDGHGAHGGAV